MLSTLLSLQTPQISSSALSAFAFFRFPAVLFLLSYFYEYPSRLLRLFGPVPARPGKATLIETARDRVAAVNGARGQ